jgi:hypothetical protein
LPAFQLKFEAQLIGETQPRRGVSARISLKIATALGVILFVIVVVIVAAAALSLATKRFERISRWGRGGHSPFHKPSAVVC